MNFRVFFPQSEMKIQKITELFFTFKNGVLELFVLIELFNCIFNHFGNNSLWMIMSSRW